MDINDFSDERIQRVTQAVLEDEFLGAAKAYAEALHQNTRRGDILSNIRLTVLLRERFVSLYLMMVEK